MLYKQPMQQNPVPSRPTGNLWNWSMVGLGTHPNNTETQNRPDPMRRWAMPTVSGPKQGGSSAYQAPSWAPQPQNQRPNTFGARPQSYRRPIRQHRSFPDRGPDSLRPDFLQRLGRRGYANYWFDGPGQGGALSHYLEQQQRRRGIGVGEPLRHPLGQRPEASPVYHGLDRDHQTGLVSLTG